MPFPFFSLTGWLFFFPLLYFHRANTLLPPAITYEIDFSLLFFQWNYLGLNYRFPSWTFMDQGEGFSCQRKDFLDTMTSYVISYVQSERSDPIFFNRKLIGRGNHFPRTKVPLLAKVPQGSEGNYSQLRFFLCISHDFQTTFFSAFAWNRKCFFA